MNHLALFNGIGGFQLAAHWVGWNNVAHVEIDPFCNKVVAKHFPESKCYLDIKEFNGKEYEGVIDIISGGDPCQPHSVAGLGKGKEDDRYFWPEYFRIVQEIQPSWIVNENVSGSITNGVLDIKIDDLESIGYTCQPVVIPAEAVGALHKRERVWIIAYNTNSHPNNRTSKKIQRSKKKKRIQKRVNLQFIGEPINLWNNITNSNRKRFEKCNNATKSELLQERVSRYFGFGNYPHGNITRNEIKSAIIRSLNGVSEGLDFVDRNKRIKALGNAIVPQVAYEIFKAIDEYEY